MLLILAHHNDLEAQWLYTDLLAAGRVPARLLMPEALGIDYDITLQLHNRGNHGVHVQFYQPAETIDGSDVSYLLNRLTYIEPLVWNNAEPAEKTYNTNELNAFFPALIEAIPCPVSNPIHHGALYGDSAFSRKWTRLLTRQGCTIHPDAPGNPERVYRLLNDHAATGLARIMLCDKEIILPPGQEQWAELPVLQRCIRDQGSVETLEFIFLRNAGGEPALLHVSKTPALSVYGPNITAFLSRKITHPYDTVDRNPERNAFAVTR